MLFFIVCAAVFVCYYLCMCECETIKKEEDEILKSAGRY